MRRWIGQPDGPGWRPVVSIAVLAAVLIVAALAQTSGGRTLTKDLGLSSPREPFTELFFAQPSAIAGFTEVPHPGRYVQRPVFVIRSDEQRAIDYHWTVEVAATVGAVGSQPLGPGQKDTISPRIVVHCGRQAASRRGTLTHVLNRVQPARSRDARLDPRPARAHVVPKVTGPSRVHVTVMLAVPRESIDYWVTCLA